MAQTLVWMVTLQLQVACLMADYVPAVKCPDPALWDRIGRYVCPGRKYFCLWDQVEQNYGEKCCIEERLEQKGKRTVLNNRNLNSIPCNTTNYQPFTFNASGNTGCIYQKSLCNEEGQLTVNFSNTIEDTQCRCDYNGGYAPVSQTKDPCYCVPALEDCTCYKKSCGTGEVLLSNYTCISQQKASQTKPCSEITFEIRTNHVMPKVSQIKEPEQEKNYTPAVIVMIFFILYSVVSYCLYIRRKKIKSLLDIVSSYCMQIKFIGNYGEIISYFEGEKVPLECKVNKPGLKNEWFKDRKVVSSDEITYKTFKVENGTMYCMVIDPVNKGDAGCYSFYKENMKVAILKVEEVKIFEELKKHYKCFIGDRVELTCLVNTEKVMGKWLKDDMDLSIDDCHPYKIENTISGNRHTLSIVSVMDEDEGTYKFSIQNNNCATELIVLEFSRSDIYNFKLNNLMNEVVKPVVRKYIFDKEFDPRKLKDVISTNRSTIRGLRLPFTEKNMLLYGKKTRHRNCENGELKKKKEDDLALTSTDFDLKVMITLLKSVAKMNISHRQPYEDNKSTEDDLSRINYIRSVLSKHKDIQEEDFKRYCEILREVTKRLAENEYDKYADKFKRFVKYNPTPEEVEKHFQDQATPVSGGVDGGTEEENVFEETKKKSAIKAARKKLRDLIDDETWKSFHEKAKSHFIEWEKSNKITHLDMGTLSDFKDPKGFIKRLDTKLIIVILNFALQDKIIPWKLDNLVDIVIIEILHGQISKSSVAGMNEAIKCLENQKKVLEEITEIFRTTSTQTAGRISTDRKIVERIAKEVLRKHLHETVRNIYDRLLPEETRKVFMEELNKDKRRLKQKSKSSYSGLSSPSVDLNVAEMWDLMNDFVKEEDKGILTALKDIIQPGEHIQLDVYTYIKTINELGGELPQVLDEDKAA